MKIELNTPKSSFLLIPCSIILLGFSSASPANSIATISIGPAWYRAGNTQTFDVQPEVVNTYYARVQTRNLGNGSVFLGRQKTLHSDLIGQLGAEFSASTPATLRGDVWQTANPLFDNFTYKYKIIHTHIALKSKLLSTQFSQFWTPYVSGSVGVGRNNAYGYEITPKVYEAVPTPGFKSNSQTAFTYTAGIGIQVSLNTQWKLGAGYEFSDWGHSSLARAPGQTVNSGLKLNHLYTNELQFNLSYYFA